MHTQAAYGNNSRLRHSLTESVAKALIHAFISSRNGVLFRVINRALDRTHLHHVLAAHHPQHLQWLPVPQVPHHPHPLTYKSLHALASQYLSDFLH